MDRDLSRICKSLNVRSRSFKEVTRTTHPLTSEEYNSVLSSISNLIPELQIDPIIFGGQTSNPHFLGYRNMRRPTGDVDSVIEEQDLFSIYDSFKLDKSLFYIPEFQKLCLSHEGIPWVFSLDYINDWRITPDFKRSKVPFNFRGTQVNLASSEYTIMMKMRRARQRGSFFGKDKLDIANLILAPCFRDDVPELDLRKAADLTKRNLGESSKYFAQELGRVSESLKKSERDLFNEQYNVFLNNLGMAA